MASFGSGSPMFVLALMSDVPAAAEFLAAAVIFVIASATVSNRRRVRWPVHAKAEAIPLSAVPPAIRPTISAVLSGLVDLGFELAVVTRATRGW